GALVLAMAAPAMALDFKFGSEYRVRFYSGSNVGFTDLPGTNPRGAQIRIRPRFDASDDNGNIQATLRLEIGDIEWGNGGGGSGVTNFQPAAAGANNVGPGGARVGNGAGGSIGNDGVNVETKWAWIDAAMPFGIPLRVRAGLQPWFEPKGLIIDDDTVGVRAYGQVKPISYEFAWYRVNGGVATAAVPAGAAGLTPTSNTIDNNYDFYGFKVNAALAPFLNPGVYYYFGMNKATAVGTPATSHYVGFTATGKAGIVSYDLDFVYGTAEGGPAGTLLGSSDFLKTKGWAVDYGVHFPLGPVTLNLVGSASTGDKRDGGDSEAFPSIAASWNGPGGLFQMIGSGGPFDAVEFTQDAPTNLWTIGATVDYRPVKRLLTTFGVAYAGFYTKKGNCANTAAPLTAAALCHGPSYTRLSDAAAPAGNGSAKGSLGTEFFIRADYDVWTGFKVMSQLGWLVPSAGDTAGEYVLQLYYSF
ncbi:MAG TPA: hypothetical protein VGC81_07170, partial [Candidatus Methylomirabilis sp.]